MSLFQILPLAACVIFVIVTLTVLMAPPNSKTDWKKPALLFSAFLVFTLYAVFTEGLLGFWPNHTQDA